ncbi:cerebellar degeneration-related protein 2-like isoform X1 [Biomphalaria glabrata]|uniref:Cerebellar degeneration-related protein 2-like isoform X1 n=1 Tax=Biomphalaria glabrata TaxID=6526 RepID=A0A2C9LCV8_BIOGL|nr:cerebellar degeneration-related protein 2-like isoform X1 [Biomphalaria glabrata]KAI8764738.1 cerebellar degeneration-related protein 2-like isoform X1 [Biomphalaria glabrata]KAI8796633.1 cerebellar degeneration-related protein 2 isoform X1 [Biomphalaria glabrata]
MESSSSYFGMEDEVVDEEWYEKNLQLAAELGKALLEKNRELESQVVQLQNQNQDQTLEIQYLKSQLDTMRTMTESRNRIYEEVDRTAQDLEKNNQRLIMEARADKQKIEKQSALINLLEEKVDDLQKKLDDLKEAEKKKVSKKAPEKRRTSSLNRLSLSDTKDQHSEVYFENLAWTHSDQFKNLPLNPYEFEIRKLQESIQKMKVQQTIDRRKMEDLEVECSVLVEENQNLEKKVNVLETKLSEAIMIQYELERAKSSPDPGMTKFAPATDIHGELHETENKLLSELEHDDPELKSEAKAVKLESGGSLYSSTESINKVATDAKEIQVGEDASLSILDELESQYQSLFTKYQALIQTKNKKGDDDDGSRQRLAHKEVQTLLHITLNRDYYQDGGHIPPYKALFKDIFATLRKNRIEENPDADADKRNSMCSPLTSPCVDGAKGLIDGR